MLGTLVSMYNFIEPHFTFIEFVVFWPWVSNDCLLPRAEPNRQADTKQAQACAALGEYRSRLDAARGGIEIHSERTARVPGVAGVFCGEPLTLMEKPRVQPGAVCFLAAIEAGKFNRRKPPWQS
jgi:hypothetical protein